MRMHTIPQNVTAYEDKIVGMLVGRQFIYLAVAGVIIFVLLGTNIGPILIRGFLSLLVGGFAAALALFKPNDRNFDSMMMSYIQAIFGPTEWVWRKDQVPLEKLRVITDQLAGRPPVVQSTPQPDKSGRDNLLRVSRFQTFISERELGMDNDELDFIEQLNFSEPVPQKAFEAANTPEKAPPMLTKQNYRQARTPTTPPVAEKPQLVRSQPKPLSPIAGSSSPLGMRIAVEGRQQGVPLRSNLRTNRSLSRQLLNSGVITLPVRGERQFDLSDELKDELKELSTMMQQTATPQKPPTRLVSGEPVSPAPAQTTMKPQPAVPASTPQASTSTLTESAPSQTEQVKRFSDYDRSSLPSISAQISMLGQAMPNSGITKVSTMTDSPIPPSSNDPNAGPATQPDQVTVMPSTPPQPTPGSVDLEQEARRIEAEAQKALSALPQPTPPSPAPQPTPLPLTSQSPTIGDSVLTTEYEAEINRLKSHSQEMELKARQAEEALHQLQQQLAGQSADNHPTIGAQQELVDKLRQQQAQSEAYRQELEQKVSSVAPPAHLHAEYAPVPQVAPVIPESATQSVPELAQPAPTVAAAPPPPPTPAVTAQDAGELDLQAKMAAAGVGTAEPVASSSTATTDIAPGTTTPQKTMALTNQPNIINGTVMDAQGQLLAGVIVVVKNAQGEAKRALKTNKLGQFVVTTSLANGNYSVEVDKKGLSFAIMQVELNGSILQPILIKSKPA